MFFYFDMYSHWNTVCTKDFFLKIIWNMTKIISSTKILTPPFLLHFLKMCRRISFYWKFIYQVEKKREKKKK